MVWVRSMSSFAWVLLTACECGQVGVTVDISARADVPALDGLRVQVTQSDLLVEQRFSLAGTPLPQSVAVVSKGLTRGTVGIVVQGLTGTRVQAVGLGSAVLEPATSAMHLGVTLERLCPGTGVCDCDPLVCSAAQSSCGRLDDGCGGESDCGGCDAGELCTSNHCGRPSCEPTSCADAGAQCGQAPDGCGHMLDCGSCPSGACVANSCGCTPLTACPPGACQQWPNGCGAMLTCANSCDGGMSCEDAPDGGGGRTCSCAPLATCSGSCVDLMADPMNCGACQHECLGGTGCRDGRCPCISVAANADGHCCPPGWLFDAAYRSCYLGPFDAGTHDEALMQCRQATLSSYGRALSAVGFFLTASPGAAAPIGTCGTYWIDSLDSQVAALDGAGGAQVRVCDPACNPVAQTCQCAVCSCPGVDPGCTQPFYCAMDPLGPRYDALCTFSWECPAGLECDGGHCLDNGEPSCVLDVDCADGGICQYRGAGQTGLCQ